MTIDDHARELDYCTYCPKLCRHSCPVSNALGHESLIPQSKMHLLNMVNKRAAPWQSDTAAPLFACTGCKLCQQYCLHGNDVAATLWEGRVEAQRRGVAPPALTDLPQRFRNRQQRLRTRLRESSQADRLAREARVGYLPGCDAVDIYLEDVTDAFAVFDSLELHFVRLLDAPLACVGYPLWAAGQLDEARLVAEEFVRALRPFATVVLGCAACTHLLRDRLPAEGFEHNTEVLHASEFLSMHAERLPVVRTRATAYYHDPCYLGRRLGVYEAPRQLVGRCVDGVREFFHSRQLAECCGGGGLVPHTFPDAAVRQAQRRLEESQLFDVPLVVTACASCKRTLRAARTPVDVIDLVNLLAWAVSPGEQLPGGR